MGKGLRNREFRRLANNLVAEDVTTHPVKSVARALRRHGRLPLTSGRRRSLAHLRRRPIINRKTKEEPNDAGT